jgi:hypothetical protein
MSAPPLDTTAAAEASSNLSILAITPSTPDVSDSKDDKLRRLWVMWPQTEAYNQSELLEAVKAASDTKRKFVGIQTVTTCEAATTNKQRVMLFVQYQNGVSLKMFKKKCDGEFPPGAIFGSLGNLHPSDSILSLEGEYSSAGNKRTLSYTEIDELLEKDAETLTQAQMRECLKRLKAERDQRISAAVAPADDGEWASRLATIMAGVPTTNKNGVVQKLTDLKYLFQRLLDEYTPLKAEFLKKKDWFMKADGSIITDREDPEHPVAAAVAADEIRHQNWVRYQEYKKMYRAAFQDLRQQEGEQGMRAAGHWLPVWEAAAASVKLILCAQADWPADFDYSGESYQGGGGGYFDYDSDFWN